MAPKQEQSPVRRVHAGLQQVSSKYLIKRVEPCVHDLPSSDARASPAQSCGECGGGSSWHGFQHERGDEQGLDGDRKRADYEERREHGYGRGSDFRSLGDDGTSAHRLPSFAFERMRQHCNRKVHDGQPECRSKWSLDDTLHCPKSTGSATIGERLAHKGAATVYLLPFLRNPFTYRKPCRSCLGGEKKQSGRDDRNAVRNM